LPVEKSDLELRLERLKYRANLKLEAAERWQNRYFTPLWERYRDGVVAVYFDIEAPNREIHRVTVEVYSRETSLGMEPNLCGDFPSLFGQDVKLSVLVSVGNLAQGFRPLDSVVRLQRLNRGGVLVVQPFQVTFAPCVKPAILANGMDLAVLNRELRAVLDATVGVPQRQFIDQVIKGGSQVVNDVADDNGQLFRNVGKPIETVLSVVLSDNLVYGCLFPLIEQIPGFGQMFIGPKEPEESAT
jgi:hypothetical protein